MSSLDEIRYKKLEIGNGYGYSIFNYGLGKPQQSSGIYA